MARLWRKIPPTIITSPTLHQRYIPKLFSSTGLGARKKYYDEMRNVTLQAPSKHVLKATDRPAPEKYYVHVSDVKSFIQSVLSGNKVPPVTAKIVAECLALADLRGIDTHGMNRLPSYLKRIRAGVLDPCVAPTMDQLSPVVAQVDCKNGFAFVAGHIGIARAVEMAQTYGVGIVSVKHSNHLGMSAWVVQQALDAGLISLVFTNASPALPVWGGSIKLMGTSPIACGVPAGRERPFILDMATTVAARGKIQKAARRGQKIPRDWALDRHGQPTDDPQEALQGVLNPIGGYKGSALAIMMDILGGVISGSAFAGGVVNPDDMSRPADVGHLFIVLRPDLFMSLSEFQDRMDHLYRTVVNADRRKGVERIYYPGEIEQLTCEERLKTGIPYAKVEVDTLNQHAVQVGVAKLVISHTA